MTCSKAEDLPLATDVKTEVFPVNHQPSRIAILWSPNWQSSSDNMPKQKQDHSMVFF
jgi:hypothetical protein